jgi:putative hydrolase of the HAD superfamily
MAVSIKALIWDFGGVLLRTEDQEPRRIWEQKLNLEAGELHDLVFQGPASRKATIGLASTEDIWREVGQRLDLQAEHLAELQRDFWSGDQLDQGLIDATRELRKHLKTALLSNAWPDLRAYLTEDLQIDDAFDLFVISAEEGTAKPDEKIYRVLLDRLNLKPSECVFIDDRQDNILAAQQLGFNVIHFQDRKQTLHDLRILLPKDLQELLPA